MGTEVADGWDSSSGAPLAVDLAFNGGPERIAEVARDLLSESRSAG
jgi:hypothetical protein